MYKYAIIGFGGLGKTHLANLISLSQQRHDIELCAICGADKSSIHSNVKLNLGEVDMSSVNLDNCNFYMDYKELFEKEIIAETSPSFKLVKNPLPQVLIPANKNESKLIRAP